MKFLPVVDLWDPAMSEAVRTGRLKLQVGQWVRCGSAQPSRFVKATRHTVWAVHPEGARGVAPQWFRYVSRVWRNLPPLIPNPRDHANR